MRKLVDLGLTYEQAIHGVQSAIAHFGVRSMEPKHLRVGIDSSHVTEMALANLLIEKGIFTEEEYLEAVRLAANDELARREKDHGVTFR